ncbi:MAG TPA: bifunctional glutamate N-acetyltransferase/amino-acid acetyltransferase ArgJ, partial [Phycisphaerales bacterium]|nr:bifunctional glutamate N-acetyltransferase/amino-acid acetyltransferase ArgJ [Phycisphaerales bacterium]
MSITRPLGFRAAGMAAGLKKSGKPDLALIVRDEPGRGGGRAGAAAVFTRNEVVGAPIHIGRAWRQAAARGAAPLRAVLINAGSSNAATGQHGIDDAGACTRAVAAALGCAPEQVLPSSTGVIGRRLDVEKITGAIPTLVSSLGRGETADAATARAILTTDLVPKAAQRELELGGHAVHIGAIAKGSGMIAPRLDSAGAPVLHGTMLAFITTDAPIGHAALQASLEFSSAQSFERISVDAHPSCSDTVVAMSSGMAPVPELAPGSPEVLVFRAALSAVCQELAQKIIRDGEGATRTFRVAVRGAESEGQAQALARAVVDSPLVKCAVHGKDPNWGRIVTAAGNAGVGLEAARTSLVIGGVEVYRLGVPTGIDKADGALRAAMAAEQVEMVLTVGDGPGSSWMIGCD